ncbi:hypothetical protein LMG32289_06668 [Cupriavidus pampae]|uniref:Uncharacterized protein n=1 Tax=Cupriavidus pampae TaxID=659251 RepID=A0ABN7ZS37_9BURK|nr:hypothetical protein LMG32289_06668 [Cupriavidus pampae]
MNSIAALIDIEVTISVSVMKFFIGFAFGLADGKLKLLLSP